MRFTIVTLIGCFVAGAAFGGESDGMRSVLVQSAPTPAPAVVEAPAPSACCTSNKCERLYSVEQQCSESCRNRLFGGKVVRKNQRTVYKPVRR
jgi:hypothetical protein